MVQYIEVMVAQQASQPTLGEILIPVRADFVASGMTENELDALDKHEQGRANHRKQLWCCSCLNSGTRVSLQQETASKKR